MSNTENENDASGQSTSVVDNAEPPADPSPRAEPLAQITEPKGKDQPQGEVPAGDDGSLAGSDTPEAETPQNIVTGPDSAPAIFSQQLWEVQLLIDFLSGNPTRRLPDQASAEAAGLPGDWVEQVCKITWPPSGSAGSQADQEALLLRVKDYLNALATPANGFSVAFTLLVTQEDDNVAAKPNARHKAGGIGYGMRQSALTESRGSLACKAYPDLVSKSRTFRRGMWWIAAGLAIWLGFTCLLSWDIAIGNSNLAQLTAAQGEWASAQAKIVDAESAQLATAGKADTTNPPAGKPSSAPSVAYCDQPKILPPVIANNIKLPVYNSVNQFDLCEKLKKAEEKLHAAQSNVRGWLWFSSDARTSDDQSVLYATALANMLGSGVLPICYGFLGAGAAVLRLLSKRMRNSLLTPRDLSLALQQLALGAVVGACIGLFVAGPTSQGSGQTGLLGPVSLSASGLSFVAGFGVDAVFSALETLIARLFNLSPSPTLSK